MSIQLIILYSCLCLFQTLVQAQDILSEDCSTTALYLPNSQFETNLNLLLPVLVSNGSQNGFFNTSIGDSPDTVYGLAQCRGDASPEDCQSCLSNITVELPQACPYGQEAARRYDLCILRYSSRRFFSQVESNRTWIYKIANVSDPDTFNLQLGSLLDTLSSYAASSPDRYNWGSVDYSLSTTIYGYVDCTRDLSSDDCLSCVQYVIQWLPTCCFSSEGVWISTLTCSVIYETLPFIQSPSLPSSPNTPPLSPPSSPNTPPLSPPPPSQLQSSPSPGTKKHINVVVIVAPIIGAVVLLVFCAVLIATRRRMNNVPRPPPAYPPALGPKYMTPTTTSTATNSVNAQMEELNLQQQGLSISSEYRRESELVQP